MTADELKKIADDARNVNFSTTINKLILKIEENIQAAAEDGYYSWSVIDEELNNTYIRKKIIDHFAKLGFTIVEYEYPNISEKWNAMYHLDTGKGIKISWG